MKCGEVNRILHKLMIYNGRRILFILMHVDFCQATFVSCNISTVNFTLTTTAPFGSHLYTNQAVEVALRLLGISLINFPIFIYFAWMNGSFPNVFFLNLNLSIWRWSERCRNKFASNVYAAGRACYRQHIFVLDFIVWDWGAILSYSVVNFVWRWSFGRALREAFHSGRRVCVRHYFNRI